jgi:tetrahydromethanopterin S-methyltransferase subunit H
VSEHESKENGRERSVRGNEIGFEAIVALAYNPVPSGDGIVIAVTYEGARGKKHDGILALGEEVGIKNGTSFNVKVNNKS